MQNFWIALGSVATVALVVVAVWQLRTSARDSRLRQRREEEAEARSTPLRRGELEREERLRAPNVSVREAGGFSGSERAVEIYADILNDGGSPARGAVAEVVIDGVVVAASTPVDVAPGAAERVSIAVPRQYVEQLAGRRPLYRGEMMLRLAE